MPEPTVKMRVWRGDASGGAFCDYDVEVGEGMVVLDVIHASRPRRRRTWPCAGTARPGKCGSCSAEVNGKPRLMCMTRMNTFAEGETITVSPMNTFPLIKDLVSDVSFNFREGQEHPGVQAQAEGADGTRRMFQEEVDRVQEFHKCIECFLCQDVCHVIRDHPENKRPSPARACSCAWPRWRCTRSTTNDRLDLIKAPGRPRLLQHHQVLHRRLPRAHQDHRQRDHSAEGAGRDRVPRSGGLGLA